MRLAGGPQTLTVRRSVMAVAFMLATALAGSEAAAQDALDCARPQPSVAEPTDQGAQVHAAERLLAEAKVNAHSIGCENHKFLIFGSDPPPQCEEIKEQIEEIKAQIARKQADLKYLHPRSGLRGGCTTAWAGPPNILGALQNSMSGEAPKPANIVLGSGPIAPAVGAPNILQAVQHAVVGGDPQASESGVDSPIPVSWLREPH